ncbi:hypothetical protein HPB51_002470 [Rhipicephalus microplus]|uniref:Uncharacterized protein n=1 Tax=Rhipicephalus microplus TaxID=6941 RepID=A0A9J6DF00_RHIMP|nr:hypothetical protein HPB51_002470 [Rhipicephalus microplus]
MATPGKTDGRLHTATVTDTQTRYDPHSMVWTSVPSSESRQELPESFKNTALARRVPASNALTAASADAAPLAAAANADASACSPTPKATDFVIVLKPRTRLSLADAFHENGAGRALIAHFGVTATRLITVVMVWEQNLILVCTSNPHIADKLIGARGLTASTPS